jgi:hypothetical protein
VRILLRTVFSSRSSDIRTDSRDASTNTENDSNYNAVTNVGDDPNDAVTKNFCVLCVSITLFILAMGDENNSLTIP